MSSSVRRTDPVARGLGALAAGSWSEARAAFDEGLQVAPGILGLL